MTWIKSLLFCLAAVAVVQTLYYYPQMPEVVASHWDGRGAPNGWSSRNAFFGLYLGIVLLLIGVFAVLPRWTLERRRGFNLPNADYWLAPERIEQTRDFISKQLIVIGVVHLALAVLIMQLAIQANFSPGSALHDSIVWLLAIYFVFLGGWLIRFVLRFRRP